MYAYFQTTHKSVVFNEVVSKCSRLIYVEQSLKDGRLKTQNYVSNNGGLNIRFILHNILNIYTLFLHEI